MSPLSLAWTGRQSYTPRSNVVLHLAPHRHHVIQAISAVSSRSPCCKAPAARSSLSACIQCFNVRCHTSQLPSHVSGMQHRKHDRKACVCPQPRGQGVQHEHTSGMGMQRK